MSTRQEVEAQAWRDQVRKIQREGGGPAFPVSDTGHMIIGTQIEGALITRGMMLRDYFAAKALVASMATEFYLRDLDRTCKEQGVHFKDGLARNAYAFADAMLKARES